ncbi:MAG: hypothetical protein EOM20_06905, partial [Spartobacteria bacterium]|nr:hypothetical protein [Spartobacteria bacterium]
MSEAVAMKRLHTYATGKQGTSRWGAWRFFQWLEKFFSFFPMIGKNPQKVSNDWKISPYAQRPVLVLVFALLSFIIMQSALGDWGDVTSWKSSAADGDWNDNHWYNVTQGWDNHNPNYEGGRDLQFDNNNQTTMANDFTGGGAGRWRITFTLNATSARTVSGSTENTFYDNGGTKPRIQNDSSASHSLGFPMKIGYSSGMEVNPISGDLTLSGNIDNNSYDLLVYGDNSKMLTLSGVVSGSGKLSIRPDGGGYPKVKISGASTFSGNAELTEGELWFATGGKLPQGTDIYVGSGSYVSDVAKLWLESAGVAITNPITVNNGNADTRYIGSLNSSGLASYRGTVALSGPVNLEANNASGHLEFTNVISGTERAVNFNGPGLVRLSGNNTYTGTNTIKAGTLQITRDTSLGAAPAAARENVNIWSSGTLEATNTFTLSANRRIAIGDVNGPKISVANGSTLTYGGQISGGAAWSKESVGKLVLTSANTFDDTLTINAGVVNAQNATALGTTDAGVTVASGAALELQGGITVGAETLNLSGSGISSGGGLRNISGNNSYAGAITMAAHSRINSDSDTLTLDVSSGNGISGTYNLTLGGSGYITVSDPIATGSGTLTKDGSGTVTLSGANTYTGGTTIESGAVIVSADNNLGAAPGSPTANIALSGWSSLQFANSMTLSANRTMSITTGGHLSIGGGNTLTYGGVTTGSGQLNITGGGRVNLYGTSTRTGRTQIQQGSLAIGADANLGAAPGAFVADQLSFDNNDWNILYITNTFTMSPNRGILLDNHANIEVTAGRTLTYAGAIQQQSADRAVSKKGAGALVLTGTNGFTGNLYVDEGTVELGGADPLDVAYLDFGAESGSAQSLLYLKDSTTVDNYIHARSGSSAINVIGMREAGSAAIYEQLRISSPILIISNAASSTLRVDFAWQNSADTTIDKQGTGTFILYTNSVGHMTNKAGTVQLGTDGWEGWNHLNGWSGSTFDLDGNKGTLACLEGAGDVTLGGGDLHITDGWWAELSGDISETGDFYKEGSGGITLSGNNTFDGRLIICQGTVKVTDDDALPGTPAGVDADNIIITNWGTLEATASFEIDSNRGI